jgi:hypothetical protein
MRGIREFSATIVGTVLPIQINYFPQYLHVILLSDFLLVVATLFFPRIHCKVFELLPISKSNNTLPFGVNTGGDEV